MQSIQVFTSFYSRWLLTWIVSYIIYTESESQIYVDDNCSSAHNDDKSHRFNNLKQFRKLAKLSIPSIAWNECVQNFSLVLQLRYTSLKVSRSIANLRRMSKLKNFIRYQKHEKSGRFRHDMSGHHECIVPYWNDWYEK